MAVIGFIGTIVGALITALLAGVFIVYQMRRTTRNEKERQEEQFRQEERMARLQKELEVQYKVKEQEQQNDATKAEALRMKMLLAPNSERLKTYRESLHTDPRISKLQILDMNRPIEVANVYVKVRVHQDTRSRYDVDPELRRAELQPDPNAIIRAGFKRLEQRSSSAIEPDEAIWQYKRCVFVGDPGAGKTTLLKYLTLKSADAVLDKLPDLPIRIELNAFANSGYHDLLDFAAADWDERYNFPKMEARIAMEDRLEEGSVLLLLDALDETVVGESIEAAEKFYQQVVEIIQRFATRYPLVPIVVTARKAGYHLRSSLVGFTELEVLDFRQEDIEQFVSNWFNCYSEPQKRANGSDLIKKLQRNPRIQVLAANPLLLSLIVLVYEAELDLPERRAELYKRCVDTLLREWDAKRNIRRRREFRTEQKEQLLAEIAWHFHLQGQRYFPETELLALVAQFLPTIRLQADQNAQILAEIANEHGLLKEQARGWQGFLHLTLQEYFVAQYANSHQQQEILLHYCGEPWWEEVILLYAGYTSDISPLLHALLGDGKSSPILQDDIFYTNLVTAGKCLSARPTIREIELWNIVVDRLFEALLKTPYSSNIQTLAETLVTIGGAEVNEHLIKLLSDEQIDRDVRGSIANALGPLGERSVVPSLVSLLSDKQIDRGVRGSIANALGKIINESKEIEELAELLPRSDVADSIHSILSTLSLRIGVRIYAEQSSPGDKQFKVVKLSAPSVDKQV